MSLNIKNGMFSTTTVQKLNRSGNYLRKSSSESTIPFGRSHTRLPGRDLYTHECVNLNQYSTEPVYLKCSATLNKLANKTGRP